MTDEKAADHAGTEELEAQIVSADPGARLVRPHVPYEPKNRIGIWVAVALLILAAGLALVLLVATMNGRIQVQSERLTALIADSQAKDNRINELTDSLNAALESSAESYQQLLEAGQTPTARDPDTIPIPPVPADGEPGAPGVPGAQGLPGLPGLPGINGANGADGTAGEPGDDGTPGANGNDGTNGQNGADGAPGAPGPQGPQGEPGATGATGATGAQGPPGPACPDGYAISFVQVQITDGSLLPYSVPAAICRPA